MAALSPPSETILTRRMAQPGRLALSKILTNLGVAATLLLQRGKT